MADHWTWARWLKAGSVIGRWVAASLILVLKSPFLAVRAAHPWVKRAEPWGILIAVLAFTYDFQDRVEERTVRAWQLLTTPAPGNSGKKEALEYLNRRDGLCWDDRCLLTLKEPTNLIGIDLSPPDRGEFGNPEDDGIGAYLLNAQLPNAYLSDARLEASILMAADLQGATLEKAHLARANLSAANLEAADLKSANLQLANLMGAKLSAADLRLANLTSAKLTAANLEGADLRGADLERAILKGAVLQGADLQEAKLQGAKLQGAKLQGANLQGAKLHSADLL